MKIATYFCPTKFQLLHRLFGNFLIDRFTWNCKSNIFTLTRSLKCRNKIWYIHIRVSFIAYLPFVCKLTRRKTVVYIVPGWMLRSLKYAFTMKFCPGEIETFWWGLEILCDLNLNDIMSQPAIIKKKTFCMHRYKSCYPICWFSIKL